MEYSIRMENSDPSFKFTTSYNGKDIEIGVKKRTTNENKKMAYWS